MLLAPNLYTLYTKELIQILFGYDLKIITNRTVCVKVKFKEEVA